jgi:basic amino acid/polyamine antiporter, APA family
MSDVSLFVRKASGLVRSWSVFDAFIYATFSINLVTLGLFIFSYCYYFGGNLISALLIGGAFTIFEVIVYASLISVMPRAGGDYVWQSRILGRGLGFVLTVTGWWFILWLWVPLYGQILTYEVLTPLFALAGARDTALFFTQTSEGQFIGSLIVCALSFIYIAIGMKWYARIQKVCFWGGMVGLVIVFALLLFGDKATFDANLQATAPDLLGVDEDVDLIATINEQGVAAGTSAAPLNDLRVLGSLALIPMVVFFNLWPNWGSTLYGEVRGASDYRRNFMGMAGAVVITATLGIIFFLLIGKTIGWEFYNNANGAFWNYTFGYVTDPPALPIWPYPALFAAFMVNSRVVQFLIILLMSLWWFGWSGTVFLSSTRVIFAAAFDRMLPEWVSKVGARSQTPIYALLLMVVPSILVSYLYAFKIFGFNTLALDATLVIAITFLGSTIAATILPWRQKDVFEGSPIANIRMPSWASWLAMLVFAAGAIYLIYSSATYAISVLGGLGAVEGVTTVKWISAIIVAIASVGNAAMLLWVAYFVGTKVFGGSTMPLVTFAGLIFMLFLDWLLVEWLWDPHVPPFDFAYYAIGWSNANSILFMLANYALAALIFFGFNAYRKRQGIDVDKVYKEIPVE